MSVYCHLCGSDALLTVAGYGDLPRVTSDCRPWLAGGELVLCGACSTLQKPTNERWRSECAAIYDGYQLYPQAVGAEQWVFDAMGGVGQARSAVLVNRLVQSRLLPPAGRLLDFGSGNGAFLRAAAEVLSGWRFDAVELDARYSEQLAAIPRFDALHQVLETVTSGCRMISMIHALEHVARPVELLQALRGKLLGDGVLFVEAPYFCDNPFDLLIADHCTHFTPQTLTNLVQRAGFEVLLVSRDWVEKEISLVARPQLSPSMGTDHAGFAGKQEIVERVYATVKWLTEVLHWAVSAAVGRRIALFGTGIPASWLAGHLGDAVAFFVDEDKGRIGRQHLGRDIFAPEGVPAEHPVLVCLAPRVAERVVRRLGHGKGNYQIPPPRPKFE